MLPTLNIKPKTGIKNKCLKGFFHADKKHNNGIVIAVINIVIFIFV